MISLSGYLSAQTWVFPLTLYVPPDTFANQLPYIYRRKLATTFFSYSERQVDADDLEVIADDYNVVAIKSSDDNDANDVHLFSRRHVDSLRKHDDVFSHGTADC